MKRLSGRRILLVEDNELNQMVAEELLRDVAGMHVSVAADGHRALELLSERRFDAVLMDLQMPVMGGLEATRLLRAEYNRFELPIIGLSAVAFASERADARERIQTAARAIGALSGDADADGAGGTTAHRDDSRPRSSRMVLRASRPGTRRRMPATSSRLRLPCGSELATMSSAPSSRNAAAVARTTSAAAR